jgi:sugar phosphate isomerase/epimerase
VARVALQLYTIRRECERDLEDALLRVGRQGYDGVEFFDLHGHEPVVVRSWLDEAQLLAAGRHARLEAIEEELPALAEEVGVLGTDRVAISWVDPELLTEPRPLVERIEDAARAARAAGLRLGFHNHWSELHPLAGGGTFLDALRELPADLLWLELDLGWIWQAGADPLDELRRTAGRCPLVHAKDYRSRDDRDDVPVGDGVVGYEQLLPAAVEAGAEWLVIEEDEVGDDPFGAVERSLHAVRRIVAAA